MKRSTYYFDKTKQDQLKELIYHKQSCIDKINILDSVKRIHKKDWSDFQNFLKNFTAWENIHIYYEMSRITIKSYVNWEKREIIIDRYTCDEKEIEEYRKSDPDRIVTQSYLKDCVYYNPDEIMIQIEKEKEKFKKSLIKYEIEIENFENNCKELLSKLDPLLDFLQDQHTKNDWYYSYKKIAIETIKTFYPD